MAITLSPMKPGWGGGRCGQGLVRAADCRGHVSLADRAYIACLSDPHLTGTVEYSALEADPILKKDTVYVVYLIQGK